MTLVSAFLSCSFSYTSDCKCYVTMFLYCSFFIIIIAPPLSASFITIFELFRSFISAILSSRPRLPFGLHALIFVFPMFIISSLSSVFLPLGGVKDDLFLTSLLSGADSRKCSFSLIFLVKSLISAAMSVVFGLGVGVNENPLYKSFACPSLYDKSEKSITLIVGFCAIYEMSPSTGA